MRIGRPYPSLFVLLCVCACTRDVDLRPEGQGTVVVECILTEDKLQTMRLSMTDIASGEETSRLGGAVVCLYDETEGNEAGMFNHEKEDVWSLEYAAVPSHSYRMDISIPGRDMIRAYTTMPDSLNLYYEIVPADLLSIGTYHIDFQSDDLREAGIRFKIGTLPDGVVWIMGMNYDESSASRLPAEKIVTDLQNADPFNLTGEVFKHEDYLDYPAVYIDPWVTRYFYLSLQDKPVHRQAIRIPPLLENPARTSGDSHGFFTIAGSFSGNYMFGESPSETDGYLLFLSSSEELDKFLKSSFITEIQKRVERDYSFLFSRENGFSNIENGVGVFGACTYQRLPWNDRPLNSYDWYDLYHPEWMIPPQ